MNTQSDTRQGWFCNLGFHQWSKWHVISYDVYPRKGIFGPIDSSVVGKEYYQRRECLFCGKTQEEKL